MKIKDAGLSHLATASLTKAKFVTIEELPDTHDELVKIKGVGPATAEEILGVKEKLAAQKGKPVEPEPEPPAAEPEAPAKEPPYRDKDEHVFPTHRWSKYQLLCILALDRKRERFMDRAAYSYLASLANGTDRPEAMRAAGLKGVLKADEFAAAEAAKLFENFALTKAREFGPAPGTVEP
jgi:hypothetical protein